MSFVQLRSCRLPQCPRTEQPPRNRGVRPGGAELVHSLGGRIYPWPAAQAARLLTTVPVPHLSPGTTGHRTWAELDRPGQEGWRWWCLGHLSVAQSKRLLPLNGGSLWESGK